MSWFRFDASTPEHPKVKKLARALGLEVPVALGYLATLWARTCSMAPSGDLGTFDAEDVAAMADWPGEPEAFVEGLVKVRLLDEVEGGGFEVHDWMDRAEGYKRAQAEKDRRAQKKREAAGKVPGPRASDRQPVEAEPQERASRTGTRGARVGHESPRVVTRGPDGQDGQDGEDGQRGQDKAGGDATPPDATRGASGELFPASPPPAPAPPVLSFPAAGRKGGQATSTFDLGEQAFGEMVAGFPSLDVEGALTECLRKVRVQAVRMPTAKGYPAFLWSWLKREADSASSPYHRAQRGAGGPRPVRGATVVDRLEEKARAAQARAQGRGVDLVEVEPGEFALLGRMGGAA